METEVSDIDLSTKCCDESFISRPQIDVIDDVSKWISRCRELNSNIQNVYSIVEGLFYVLSHYSDELVIPCIVTEKIIYIMNTVITESKQSIPLSYQNLVQELMKLGRKKEIKLVFHHLFHVLPLSFVAIAQFLIQFDDNDFRQFVVDEVIDLYPLTPEIVTFLDKDLFCDSHEMEEIILHNAIDMSSLLDCCIIRNDPNTTQLFTLYRRILHSLTYSSMCTFIVQRVFSTLSMCWMLQYWKNISTRVKEESDPFDVTFLINLFTKYYDMSQSNKRSALYLLPGWSQPPVEWLPSLLLDCIQTFISQNPEHITACDWTASFLSVQCSFLLMLFHATSCPEQQLQHDLSSTLLSLIKYMQQHQMNAELCGVTMRVMEIAVEEHMEWQVCVIGDLLKEFDTNISFLTPTVLVNLLSNHKNISDTSRRKYYIENLFSYIFSPHHGIIRKVLSHVVGWPLLVHTLSWSSHHPYDDSDSTRQIFKQVVTAGLSVKSSESRCILFRDIISLLSCGESSPQTHSNLRDLLIDQIIMKIDSSVSLQFTNNSFNLSSCIQKTSIGDYVIIYNPLIDLSVVMTADNILSPLQSSLIPYCQSIVRCSQDIHWIEEQSDALRDDVMFPALAFAPFSLLLYECFMFTATYSIDINSSLPVDPFCFQLLYTSTEMENCIENKRTLLEFKQLVLNRRIVNRLIHTRCPYFVDLLLSQMLLHQINSTGINDNDALLISSFVLSKLPSRQNINNIPFTSSLFHKNVFMFLKEICPKSLSSSKRRSVITVDTLLCSLLDQLVKKYSVVLRNAILSEVNSPHSQVNEQTEDEKNGLTIKWLTDTLNSYLKLNPSPDVVSALSRVLRHYHCDTDLSSTTAWTAVCRDEIGSVACTEMLLIYDNHELFINGDYGEEIYDILLQYVSHSASLSSVLSLLLEINNFYSSSHVFINQEITEDLSDDCKNLLSKEIELMSNGLKSIPSSLHRCDDSIFLLLKGALKKRVGYQTIIYISISLLKCIRMSITNSLLNEPFLIAIVFTSLWNVFFFFIPSKTTHGGEVANLFTESIDMCTSLVTQLNANKKSSIELDHMWSLLCCFLPLMPCIVKWSTTVCSIHKYCNQVNNALGRLQNQCVTLLSSKTLIDTANKHYLQTLSLITPHIPQKQRIIPQKRKSKRRLFNRNPVVNAMLDDESGDDNYGDLVDFIDPTPDRSLDLLYNEILCLCSTNN